MVFSSNIFLFAFLPLVFLSYFLLPYFLFKFFSTKNLQKPNLQVHSQELLSRFADNFSNSILLLASLIFYAWGEFQYLILLLLSILGNYFFGISLQNKFCQKYLRRSLILFCAIAFNLLPLVYFKYGNFLLTNISKIFSLQFENPTIHLPIGISFFTFHAISYIVDIYRKKCCAQRNLFQLALYISFFPQLVAGPIVRYNFIEKYLAKRRHNLFFVSYGIRRFLIGIGKKIIIANPLGEVADAIFNSSLSDIDQRLAWIGIVCYTLQIYFDFSGYSDMAVGLARIFGFKFPENFNYPYIASSIKDFWRRWHMSLSSWFRDYVYITLGGNRVSVSRQYFNLVLVFFLCGLWHGASWNFVIWGMFHGAFLVFERLKVGESFINFLPRLLQNFYTIFVVMIAWVFFRSPDLIHAFGFLKKMFCGNFFGENVVVATSDVSRLLRSHLFYTSLVLAIFGFSPVIKNLSLKLMRKNQIFVVVGDVFLIVTFLFAIVRLSAATHNPFIYFQF